MIYRKKIMFNVAGILTVLFILTTAAGFFFASSSMRIRRQTLDEARQWQEDHYDLSWYDPLEKMDYQVTSYNGCMFYECRADQESCTFPDQVYHSFHTAIQTTGLAP